MSTYTVMRGLTTEVAYRIKSELMSKINQGSAGLHDVRIEIKPEGDYFDITCNDPGKALYFIANNIYSELGLDNYK